MVFVVGKRNSEETYLKVTNNTNILVYSFNERGHVENSILNRMEDKERMMTKDKTGNALRKLLSRF